MKQMEHILALDPEAHLRYSLHTGGWYVRTSLGICDGTGYVSVSLHRSCIADAVTATFLTLTDVRAPWAVRSEDEHGVRYWRFGTGTWFEVEPPGTEAS